MQELFVDTTAALMDLTQQLEGSEWLALDTEFIREKTYFPRLCLIQISNGDIAACVDPLAIDDLSPLLDVIYDGSIIKVIHAARQDLEIFLHDWGHLPLPLFDTQPAAALLGYGDQVGYANLVQQVLGLDLAKNHSRTDWTRRPLDEGQVRYALDDVVYLGQVYVQMRGRLSDRDRLQWLAADFAELADPATYVQHPATAWKRIKGRQHLRGVQLAILQALAAWREEQALARDLPRRWVIKDEILVELARRKPKNAEQLGQIRGLEPAVVRREGDALLAAVEAGLAVPKQDWPHEGRIRKKLTSGQEAQADVLSAVLRQIADAHQLSPHAIAARKDLDKLVQGDHDTPVMEGWRRKVAGEKLLQILDGQWAVSCEQDSISIIPVPG